MIERDELVRAAARNNASWCEAMCRSYGIAGKLDATMWASGCRTPPLYPDAVTLSPHASAEDILARIDREMPGASVKDSFGCLDLSDAGFGVLFEAQWIYRPADRPLPASPKQVWTPVNDPDELAVWATAWDRNQLADSVFRPELLVEDSVSVLGRWNGDRVVAGAVVHRSETMAGLSNMFYSGIGAQDAWAECLTTVARLWPGRSIVGYERGQDLAAAVRNGCWSIGALRVWLALA
ncbi:hypothetical protein [Nocardia sp. NPDC004604]|uniref:hypothetical protein n=1 Tax=Nocardia sp. NPDC004604 TaxID=3157013 RepID=UPI0033AE8B94